MPKTRSRPLRIGLSANVYQPDFSRMAYKGRRLLYAEESMAHWVMASGHLAFVVPSSPKGGASPGDLLDSLDALIITGGVDMSPLSYGEKPKRPEWTGDQWRDDYEIALVRAALAREKPLLGICRGHQVLNVALGGSLYQDVYSQHPGSIHHRIFDVYEMNHHHVSIERGGRLHRMFKKTDGVINSVHHQAVKKLGKGLKVEARSQDDGVVEAFTLAAKDAPFLLGVQWHPELQDPKDKTLLSPKPILQEFLAAAEARRS